MNYIEFSLDGRYITPAIRPTELPPRFWEAGPDNQYLNRLPVSATVREAVSYYEPVFFRFRTPHGVVAWIPVSGSFGVRPTDSVVFQPHMLRLYLHPSPSLAMQREEDLKMELVLS